MTANGHFYIANKSFYDRFSNNFSIPKSRDLDVDNPGIRDCGKGPGSRDPGIRDPGIAIPTVNSIGALCSLRKIIDFFRL